MIEINENIWNFYKDDNWIVITTNGTIKRNGECVMGRGIALQCKNLYPEFPKLLGDLIKEQGNRVGVFLDYNIITLPVKHNWYEIADLKLIEEGINQLAYLKRSVIDGNVYLTRAGCGNGRRDWSEVRPIYEKYLTDDGFIVCNL